MPGVGVEGLLLILNELCSMIPVRSRETASLHISLLNLGRIICHRSARRYFASDNKHGRTCM